MHNWHIVTLLLHREKIRSIRLCKYFALNVWWLILGCLCQRTRRRNGRGVFVLDVIQMGLGVGCSPTESVLSRALKIPSQCDPFRPAFAQERQTVTVIPPCLLSLGRRGRSLQFSSVAFRGSDPQATKKKKRRQDTHYSHQFELWSIAKVIAVW